MKPDPFKVSMLVTNEVTFDSRVLREARTLSSLGFEVCILGMDRSGDSLPVEEVEGFRIFRCQEWRLVRWLRTRRGMSSNLLRKGLTALRYFLFSLRARGDVIHAHDLDTLPFGFLAARRCKAKLIYDSHEIYTEQWPSDRRSKSFSFVLRMMEHLESLLIRRADATLCVSPSIAAHLGARYRIPPPMVLRNCAEPNVDRPRPFHLRDLVHIQARDRIVVHTGSLVPFGRSLKELILAFRKLASNCHLVFLGEGSMKKELQELVREEGLEDRVHFLKPVPPQDLVGTIAEADLAAVIIRGGDCRSYLYSLPNKLFEAIAAGLPVVASGLPDIRDIVEAYEIGILCHPEDPQDIARAIEEALAPDRYPTLKANLERAQRELSWERESRKLSRLYQTLVIEPESSGPLS